MRDDDTPVQVAARQWRRQARRRRKERPPVVDPDTGEIMIPFGNSEADLRALGLE